MTVFLSGDIPSGFALDPKSDLHGMTAQEVDLHAVPGERYTMMQEPHVATLAAKLKSCLPAFAGGTPIAT